MALEQTIIEQTVGTKIPAEVPPNPSTDQGFNESEKSLFDYDTVKPRLTQLISNFEKIRTKVAENRAKRKIDISPAELRAAGKLKPDETIVPIRVIDTNIKREKPAYKNFLNNSRRLSIFKCLDKPDEDTQTLEKNFTEGMTYPKWDKPHDKCLDGAQVHGWDSVEVVLDDSKPLNVAHEHIGTDKLIFPLDAEDLQACEILLREYSISQSVLKSFVTTFGFSEKVVKEVTDKYKGSSEQDKNVKIYKKFCKYNGQVYVSWFYKEGSAWLKSPQPYTMGRRKQVTVMQTQMVPTPQLVPDGMGGSLTITPMQEQEVPIQEWQDIPLTVYPIFLLPYEETEEEEITSCRGRVALDSDRQEAMTAVVSGYVNGVTRAANVYGSLENDPAVADTRPKLLDIDLEHGRIYNKKVNFWGTAYPDPSVISGVQYLEVEGSQESGQMSFAVNNRKDSRKTATEVQTANQQTQLLSTVSVANYSSFIRDVYSFSWIIVQSQVLQGKVTFLLIPLPQEQLNMETQQPEITWTNDLSRVGMKYDVRAAGDVDVIQRAEKVNNMKTDWPVIRETAAAIPFLKEMLRISYPDTADKWIQILDQGDVGKQLVAQLSTILEGLITNMPQQKLSPEDQQQLLILKQQVEQYLNSNAEQASTAAQTQ